MENVSKALIIVAEILIGVLLLTLMVFLFRSAGDFTGTVEDNIKVKNNNEFNTKFEQYRDRKDLTPQDVISIANLARSNNQLDNREVTITVTVTGVESQYTNAHTLTDEKAYEFIQKYAIQNNVYFECQNIHYHEEIGKIDKIILKKI